MPTVHMDGAAIRDWSGFHSEFARAFRFPDFYGRNLDAWIDCMSDIGEGGMADVPASPSDPVVIWIDSVEAMPAELLDALADCVAFVNWRNGDAPNVVRVALAYHRPHRG